MKEWKISLVGLKHFVYTEGTIGSNPISSTVTDPKVVEGQACGACISEFESRQSPYVTLVTCFVIVLCISYYIENVISTNRRVRYINLDTNLK